MKTKVKIGILIVGITLLFNLNSLNMYSESILKLDEIEALACGENGCTKDYSKVQAEETNDGEVWVTCTGCGSLKCRAPKLINNKLY